MRILVAAILCFNAAVNASENADELVIDDFYFGWTVETSGDAELIVSKTQDGMAIFISKLDDDDGSIMFTVKEAVAVGKAFKRTDEFRDKFSKSTKTIGESIEVANGVTVTFSRAESEGFLVYIEQKPDDIMSLTRNQAVKFTKHLLMAEKLAKFVDTKVMP